MGYRWLSRLKLILTDSANMNPILIREKSLWRDNLTTGCWLHQWKIYQIRDYRESYAPDREFGTEGSGGGDRRWYNVIPQTTLIRRV